MEKQTFLSVISPGRGKKLIGHVFKRILVATWPDSLRRFAGFVTSMMIVGLISGQAAPGVEPNRTGPAPRRGPLVLNYVANEGVLVSSGDAKVLIDSLFDKPNKEYRAPSSAVLEQIIRGEAPYDGVDLLLVTHNHADHFDPVLAARYLETSAKPICWPPRMRSRKCEKRRRTGARSNRASSRST